MFVPPAEVHGTLARSILVEGYPFVIDLTKSHGQWLHDAITGTEYLDFFTFFASRPIAFNHPALMEPVYLERQMQAVRCKPSNCDLYTSLYAEFVETFRTKCMGPGMQHLFFVDGGALAVENALKAAFDWKARKNLARGKEPNPGQVIHFKNAFHGRSGYTLSLTNTADPRKTQYFPKFPWPRVSSPACDFPIDLERQQRLEAQTLREIDEVYARLGADDVACIIIEPIQAEGGDRHFRPEFLQALRKICDEREALLIFDEVQTGVGSSGTMWIYEQLGVQPDVVAFAKKAQTGGIMASRRLDEVDSVFAVKSRISSTFCGNLSDFVRCQRYLEVIRGEDLLGNVRTVGAAMLQGLTKMVASHKGLSNPRGRGLLLAFDAPDGEVRDRIINRAREEKLILLPCGERSVRLRPALDITMKDAELGMQMLARALSALG